MYKKVKQSNRFNKVNLSVLDYTKVKRVCELQEDEYFVMNGIEYVVERIDEEGKRLYYKSAITPNKATESLEAKSQMKVYTI